MREYKFRGLTPDKKWIYGHYIQKNHVNSKSLSIQHLICVGDDFLTVRGKTVGEYIGEKDKNNKEIYEDDIMKYGGKSIHGKPFEQIDVVRLDDGGFYPVDKFSFNNLSGVVIGNIHDNPELLEA